MQTKERSTARTVRRVVALAGRTIQNPSILPEIVRKVSARLTERRHRHRTHQYKSLSVSFADWAKDALAADHLDVERLADEPSFRGVVAELEEFYRRTEHREMGASYLEACYLIVRLLEPEKVVEVGVALGYSTAVILQALSDNGAGSLYSLDLPAFRPGMVRHTATAVPDRMRRTARWELTLGPQRRRLAPLLARVGLVDLVLYDSDKSYAGMIEAWHTAWRNLRPGGVLMADGILHNDAFLDFAQAVGVRPYVIPKPTRRSVYPDQAIFFVGLLRKPA